MKQIFLIIAFFTAVYSNAFADNSYFIDFDKVLNLSKAGKSAQISLKKNLIMQLKNLKNKKT